MVCFSPRGFGAEPQFVFRSYHIPLLWNGLEDMAEMNSCPNSDQIADSPKQVLILLPIGSNLDILVKFAPFDTICDDTVSPRNHPGVDPADDTSSDSGNPNDDDEEAFHRNGEEFAGVLMIGGK
ncbi:hypothetical protein BLNAU_17350 [Blattamonas nauphoetae]|uniref:Uncharacterized protein n=1 Tax=Blattamonas nauphoetae TaxID=2049346 RepID=A0ABQ9X8X4_9EUKA|nr:hypothetical protein BLNAU_17350 [Blattamonas nauphoetae]